MERLGMFSKTSVLESYLRRFTRGQSWSLNQSEWPWTMFIADSWPPVPPAQALLTRGSVAVRQHQTSPIHSMTLWCIHSMALIQELSKTGLVLVNQEKIYIHMSLLRLCHLINVLYILSTWLLSIAQKVLVVEILLHLTVNFLLFFN